MVKRSLWFNLIFFMPLLSAGDRQGEEEDEGSSALLLHSLCFCPSLSVSLFSFFHPLTLLLLVLLPGHVSLPLSFLFFITHLPPLFPALSFSFSLHGFVGARVEVISRCVTLAMCRQWMGALAATRQPRIPNDNAEPEREIITHTHEKICAFSQNDRNEIAGILFIASFFPSSDWWPSQWMLTPCLWFWLNALALWMACKAAAMGSVYMEILFTKVVCLLDKKIDCTDIKMVF